MKNTFLNKALLALSITIGLTACNDPVKEVEKETVKKMLIDIKDKQKFTVRF